MVATTFAADTPLVVTGLVAANGVAGNWLWWNMVMSGMLTVFFFARLWRRAGVMTDVEFAEIRYSGKPARVPARLPRALPRDPDQPDHPRLGHPGDDQDPHDLARRLTRIVAVGICFVITVVYSVAAGLWAVLWTDLVQFVIKMTAVIMLAVYVGEGGRRHGRAEGRASSTHFGSETAALSVLPVSVTPTGIAGVRVDAAAHARRVPLGAVVGGMVSRAPSRAAAATSRSESSPRKTERDGVLATLFFQVAHYALRPWPWIVTGLATVILYPERSPTRKPATCRRSSTICRRRGAAS